MNLAHLSLQRCKRGRRNLPAAPTNDERRRAFAALQRPQPNAFAWQFRQREDYARNEAADGRARSTDERF